jgi:CRISPR-associated protein Csb3
VTGSQATIRVTLDPTNPGQFFGCCGLLELADRLWAGAEGWFDSPESFCLCPSSGRTGFAAEQFIKELTRCPLTNTMTAGQIGRLEELSAMTAKERRKHAGLEEEKKQLEKLRWEEPIVLHEPFHVRVDWFRDNRVGGERFKTWAGKQSVLDIAQAMKAAIAEGGWDSLAPARWLMQSAGDTGLPFNFDSDLGAQSAALDIGFSCHPLGVRTRTRPMTEFAAFVGLQRFRPGTGLGDNRYRFALWPEPLTPEIAAVAACGILAMPGTREYEFRLLYRTKYLKSFLPAQRLRGDRWPN